MSTRSHSWIILSAAILASAAGCTYAVAPSAAPANASATASAPAAVRGEGEGGAAARGDGGGRAGGAVRGGRGGTPATPANLESAMGDMERKLRALKTESADPTKAEQTLTDLVAFERDVAISKALIPPTINRLAAGEQAAAITSYRAMMTGLTRTLLDLEDAVNDKKPDEIKKLLAQLDELEKQGHAEFKPAGD